MAKSLEQACCGVGVIGTRVVAVVEGLHLDLAAADAAGAVDVGGPGLGGLLRALGQPGRHAADAGDVADRDRGGRHPGPVAPPLPPAGVRLPLAPHGGGRAAAAAGLPAAAAAVAGPVAAVPRGRCPRRRRRRAAGRRSSRRCASWSTADVALPFGCVVVASRSPVPRQAWAPVLGVAAGVVGDVLPVAAGALGQGGLVPAQAGPAGRGEQGQDGDGQRDGEALALVRRRDRTARHPTRSSCGRSTRGSRRGCAGSARAGRPSARWPARCAGPPRPGACSRRSARRRRRRSPGPRRAGRRRSDTGSPGTGTGCATRRTSPGGCRRSRRR